MIDLLKLLTLSQNFKNLERNLNNNYLISEQVESNNKSSSESEEVFKIIYVAIRPAAQASEQLKGNIVPREQTSNKLYFIKSR